MKSHYDVVHPAVEPLTPEPPLIESLPDSSPPGSPSQQRETIAIPVYHWSEVQSLCSRLHPDMLRDEGMILEVNCRLKGQPQQGIHRVPPERRLVRHNIGYCAYRLQTILGWFTREQVETLFAEYLDKCCSGKHPPRYPH